MAGNIGHVQGHDVLVRATAAVPPLAAAAALAVGLGVLKRVVEMHSKGLSVDRHEELSGTAAETVAPTGSPTGTQELSGDGSHEVPGQVRPALPAPIRTQGPNRTRKRGTNRSARATDADAETEFAAEIAAGHVPTLYQIRTRLHVGNERAKVLRQHIARRALIT